MADARHLSGTDAAFLYLEMPQTPMHVGVLAIYDPTTAPGGFARPEDIYAHVAARLDMSPILRQRIQRVPMGLDHPYFVDDPNFDLDDHISHVRLPAPGDWNQLCKLAARLFARPLDLANPLWELTIIEGLGGVPGAPAGAFALLWKIHHCALDGLGVMDFLESMQTAEPVTPPFSPLPWQPNPTPSTQDLLDAARDHAQQLPMASLDFIRRVAPRVGEAVKATGPETLKQMIQAPRTDLQGPVSGKRVVEGRTFSLQMAEEIRRAVPGATLNDVFLATIGGALRAYLSRRAALPMTALRTALPVSLRTPADRGAPGNKVSVMLVGLGTDIEDPIKRLKAVQRSSLEAKAFLTAIGPRETIEIMDLIPPPAMSMAARAAGEFGLAEHVAGAMNTIVFNTPGSRHALYCAGARCEVSFALMPVPDGVGLVHGVHSYGGAFTITLTACRERLPDPQIYAEDLAGAFAALRSAALATPPETAQNESIGKIVEDWRDWKMADYPLGADIETLLNRMQAGMESLKDALRRTGTTLDHNQRRMTNLVMAQAEENLRATMDALRSTMTAKDTAGAMKAQGEAVRAAFERSLSQVREISQLLESAQDSFVMPGTTVFTPSLRSASDFFAQLRQNAGRVVPDDVTQQIERYIDSMQDAFGEMRESLRDVRGNVDVGQQQVMSLVLTHARENLDKTYETFNKIVGSKDPTETVRIQATALQDAIERGVSQVRQVNALLTDSGQAAFEPIRDFYTQLGSASDFFSRLNAQAGSFNFPSFGGTETPLSGFAAMGTGDAEKLMETMRGNMKELQTALQKSGETMTESQREVAELLMAHARENMDESMKALRDVAQSGDIAESLRLQGNALRDSLSRNMRQIREVTELVSSGSQDAMKPLSQFFEQLRAASEALANLAPQSRKDDN